MSAVATSLSFTGRREAARDLLWLGLIFGAVYVLFAGHGRLASPDEARYAEIPREMLISGDWITPRLNGVNYFEKPPLGYWLVAVVFQLGGISETTARVMPALAALGGVLLVYGAGRRWYGRRAGLAAAVMLGSSLLYFVMGRLLLLDLLLSVFMGAALVCFLAGALLPPSRARRMWWYGFYVAAALATLTKGLIGFVLPGLVIGLWLLLFDQWRTLRPMYLPTGLAVFGAITVPWHVAVAARHPEWFSFYFGHEHFARFTTTVHHRVEPWWFFIPILVLGLFPWSGLLPAAGRRLVAGGWARRRENAVSGFFAVWIGVILVFFSAAQSKLVPYIVPVFPALAILLAREFAEAAWWPRSGLRGFGVMAALLAAAAAVVAFAPDLLRINPVDAAEVHSVAALMAVILGLGGALTWWWQGTGRTKAAWLSAVATAGIFYAVIVGSRDRIQRPGTETLAAFVRDHVAPTTPIFHYRGFFHDFVFYAGRFVGTIDYDGDEIELANDAGARASGRFIALADLKAAWRASQPICVIVRKADGAAFERGMGAPAFVLATSTDYLLLGNSVASPVSHLRPARRSRGPT